MSRRERLLKDISVLNETLQMQIDAVASWLEEEREEDAALTARRVVAELEPAMDRLRTLADHLEAVVPVASWPLPSYRDLWFIK
ncbi:MAG: hypothetical protein H6816_06740 [Phycisphaerales bacterium]|nr:hypothetical protein [Phycisphaerales bacterium]